ncbi:metal-dependent hydrolase [Halalkalibacillus sediminis]|uniref:UPF0173 metal-dependent hydrolase CEY16_05950 n=1 Tax=Halalkalibacillus sediminis TaxID=2018042 RepID=A0A2I0QY65_9BACI|nr:metal-dependent hydrolase [Halalkalibacillus sediminis]PKR79281.1 metal-dependent hydrolase [Halalkalibacillus sediminis]
MNISYHGHSVVQVQDNDKKIIIDPFISGNELCDLNADEVKADYILLTHGHNDHVGDTEQIAKNNDALIIAPFELATYFENKGLNAHPMHIGGAHTFDFGTVKLTQAFHGSAFFEDDGSIVYTGMPSGILLTIGGKTVYHMGDTGLFSDMKLIGDRNDIDLAFVPIGDNFTMGPEDAQLACEWIKAKQVVPIHFDTFDVIKQDPESFVDSLQSGVGKVMKPGDQLSL